MLHLRRLRLENVGHPAAGFKSLVLDLTGGTSSIDGVLAPAVDVILWLRNGGGKSTLLSLFFSLFLPAKTDFIGHSEGKSLADYVPDGRVSHVVAEWEDSSRPADGPALVTGGVYQWQDGHKPADPGSGWERLVRRWYVFRPLPGVMDLDSLPVRCDAGQCTQSSFLAELTAVHKAQRAVGLGIATDQTQWRDLLADVGLDPGVLRIQRDMNREEGGITDLFRFATCEEFVDFLIDLICQPQQPSAVRSALEEQSAKLAQRPNRELEQQFLAQAVLALRQVQQHSAEVGTVQEGLGQSVALALRAADRLGEQAEATGLEAGRVQEQADQAHTGAEEAEVKASEESRRVVVLQEVAARHAAADSEADLRACEEAEATAAVTEDAWTYVEVVQALQANEAELAALRELLSRQDGQLAPLRTAMEKAGAALCDKLASCLRQASEQEQQARAQQEHHAAQLREAHAGQLAAAKVCGQAESRLASALKVLAQAEADVAAARAEGRVGAREEVAQAVQQLEQHQAEGLAELERCRTVGTDTEAELADLSAQRLRCAARASEVREQHEQAWDRLSALRAERRELTGHARLLELACTPGGALADLDEVGGDLLELLEEQARRWDTELACEHEEAAQDRRALQALEASGFLPAPQDVEQAVDALCALGAQAVSGLQFLRETFPVHRHEQVLATVPHLVGGVVVCGPVPGDDLAALARKVKARTAVLTVGLDDQARQAVADTPAGPVNVVLPVNRALLEEPAADRERERLTQRVAGLDVRLARLMRDRDNDDALARRLRTHLEVFGRAGRGELEQAVERLDAETDLLHTQEQQYTGRIGELHAQAADARARGAEATRLVMETAEHLPRLRELAERLATVVPACRQEADQARAELVAQRNAMGRFARRLQSARSRRDAAEAQVQRCAEAVRRHHKAASALAAELPEAAAERRVRTEQADAAPLEVLQARYEQARNDWQQQIGDEGMRARADKCARRIGTLTAKLAEAGDEAVNKAIELARTVSGLDEPGRKAAAREAKQALLEASGRRGAARDRHKQAAEAWDQAQQAVAALQPPCRPDEVPAALGAEAARSQLDTAQAAAQAAQEQVHEQQLAATRLQAQAQRAQDEARNLTRCVEHLRRAAARHPAPESHAGAGADRLDALLDERHRMPAGTPLRLTADQVTVLENALTTAIDQAAQARDGAVRKLDRLVRQVENLAQSRAYADVVEGLLLERLRCDLAVPTRLGELIDDVVLREHVVAGELAELAEDQLLVVQACLGLVKTVLDDLKEVARHSRLPQGLGVWSGQQFLGLEFRHLPDDEVLSRRLSAEVDRMCQAAANTGSGKASVLPEPMTLAKRLVLAALGGSGNIVAKIIKPTQSLDHIERNSVTQIRKFSGGERLTISVLLYCTLARLRAAKQGRRMTGGVGTLILDNPIGKANYTPFIGLQRQVARAHGVQLVYTTGSNDFPALERFPLVIRLRNGIDTRTKAHYIRIADRYGDAVADGVERARRDGITSARLMRRPGAAPTAHASHAPAPAGPSEAHADSSRPGEGR